MQNHQFFDFKNASKRELSRQYAKIAKEFGDDSFFTKKELNYLPKILRQKEQVLGFASGLMEGNTWLVALTDHRVVFLDKGFFFGLKQVDLSLSKINSVSCKSGLLFGSIEIHHGSTSMVIKNVRNKFIHKFTNKLQNMIENAKAPKNSSNSKPEDKYDILARIAKLKDSGAISEKEYEIEKNKILSS